MEVPPRIQAHFREVFIFGCEVDDFRSVDCEAIAMPGVSATQERHRLLGGASNVIPVSLD